MRPSLGVMGAPVLTPHMDHLAAESLLFDRAFANFPWCNPSRSTSPLHTYTPAGPPRPARSSVLVSRPTSADAADCLRRLTALGPAPGHEQSLEFQCGLADNVGESERPEEWQQRQLHHAATALQAERLLHHLCALLTQQHTFPGLWIERTLDRCARACHDTDWIRVGRWVGRFRPARSSTATTGSVRACRSTAIIRSPGPSRRPTTVRSRPHPRARARDRHPVPGSDRPEPAVPPGLQARTAATTPPSAAVEGRPARGSTPAAALGATATRTPAATQTTLATTTPTVRTQQLSSLSFSAFRCDSAPTACSSAFRSLTKRCSDRRCGHGDRNRRD